jgi:hypothetical protein
VKTRAAREQAAPKTPETAQPSGWLATGLKDEFNKSENCITVKLLF